LSNSRPQKGFIASGKSRNDKVYNTAKTLTGAANVI